MVTAVTQQAQASSTPEMVFWCGSEASYEAYIRGRDAIMAAIVAGTLKADMGDEGGMSSHLLSRSGNIGIITVQGALTNDDNPFNRFFGMTSYAEIGRALQAAVADPAIQKIAMNYSTPGGAVNGVHDLASNIKLVSDTMKPVHTYTGGTMASAGLWLGASGKDISVSPTAVVGSIGILQVHREASKMYADMGVKTTVIRQGKYKALVNPHEPLSDEAKAQAEKLMEEIYGVFMGHVASARGMDYAKADAAYGQGREFVGQQAVDVGLASRVTSFDKFIASLQQAVDKKQGDTHNPGNYQRGKAMNLKALNQATVDAMKASGLTDEQILAADEKAFEAKQKEEAEAKRVAEAAAAAVAQAQSGQGLSATALLEKVTAQAAELHTAKAAVTAAEAKVAPLEAALESCRAIITASLNTMKVALGGTAVDTKATSLLDVLKMHAETETSFKAKFPTGQVSATSSVASEADKAAVPDWAARAELVVASTKKA